MEVSCSGRGKVVAMDVERMEKVEVICIHRVVELVEMKEGLYRCKEGLKHKVVMMEVMKMKEVAGTCKCMVEEVTGIGVVETCTHKEAVKMKMKMAEEEICRHKEEVEMKMVREETCRHMVGLVMEKEVVGTCKCAEVKVMGMEEVET